MSGKGLTRNQANQLVHLPVNSGRTHHWRLFYKHNVIGSKEILEPRFKLQDLLPANVLSDAYGLDAQVAVIR